MKKKEEKDEDEKEKEEGVKTPITWNWQPSASRRRKYCCETAYTGERPPGHTTRCIMQPRPSCSQET